MIVGLCTNQLNRAGAAVLEALKRPGLSLVGAGVYVRNAVNPEGALNRIAKIKPDAVIMFGTYKPCAHYIRGASLHRR